MSRQSPAIIIEAGDYVSYEATVTNAGGAAPGEGTLQAHFVSAGGKSDSQAEFAVPPLAPGQSKHLHLGPFKVAQAGDHFLYLGTDGAELADSFVAYGDGTGNAAVAGVAIASAGGALVAWYLRNRTRA